MRIMDINRIELLVSKIRLAWPQKVLDFLLFLERHRWLFLLFLALTGIFIKLPIVAITSLIISFFIYISPVIAGKVVESTKKRFERRRKFLEKKGELLEQMENGKTLEERRNALKELYENEKKNQDKKIAKILFMMIIIVIVSATIFILSFLFDFLIGLI
jgi:hypothetical protein